MTTAVLASSIPWGDRTTLLPRKMVYTCSLQLEVTTEGPSAKVTSATMRHLFDEFVVMMPEGLRVDLPEFAFRSGNGQIGSPADSNATKLSLRIIGIVGVRDAINVEVVGTINFDGGPASFQARTRKEVRGAAFVAVSCETASATYRWMGRRLLFGVGRMEGTQVHSGKRDLTFAFDLYAAA